MLASSRGSLGRQTCAPCSPFVKNGSELGLAGPGSLAIGSKALVHSVHLWHSKRGVVARSGPLFAFFPGGGGLGPGVEAAVQAGGILKVFLSSHCGGCISDFLFHLP